MAIRGSLLGSAAIVPVGGPAGAPGQSAYQAWLALGNTGSLADYMAAQRGKDGTNGKDGVGILATATAAVAIPAWTLVVALSDGTCAVADPTVASHCGKLLGLVLADTAAGAAAAYQSLGAVVGVGGVYLAGQPLWIGDGTTARLGAVVNAPPGTGAAWRQQVGTSTGATSISLRPGPALLVRQAQAAVAGNPIVTPSVPGRAVIEAPDPVAVLPFVSDGQGAISLDMRTVTRLRRHAAFYGVSPANTSAQNKLAMDYALAQAAATGCEMTLPDGDIACDPLAVVPGNNTFGFKLRGSPRTRFLFTGDGNCITFGDGTTPVLNLQLEQFEVWSSTNRTVGAGIAFNKLSKGTLDRVSCGSPISWTQAGGTGVAAARRLFNGFVFNGVVEVEFRTSVATGCAGTGLILQGPSDQSFGAEFRITGHSAFSQSGMAIRIQGGIGGVYLSQGAVFSCDAGVRIDQSNGAANREVFWETAFTVDTCTGVGLQIAAGGLIYLIASGLWCCGHGSHGVQIDPGQSPAALFVFVQPRCRSNGGQNFYHLGGLVWMTGGDLSLGANSGLVTGNPNGDAALIWRGGLAQGNVAYALNILPTATKYLIDGLDKIANGAGGVNGHAAASTKTIRNGTTDFAADA